MTKFRIGVQLSAMLGLCLIVAGCSESSDGKSKVIASIAMVTLPAGSFAMGVKEGAAHEEQAYPAHGVHVPSFRIAKTTVTFDQYDEFARETQRALPQDEGFGRGTRPVINVDRQDALDFIAWLNAGTGHRFRLPSESESEYAARGGTATPYFWGDRAAASYANVTKVGTVGRFTGTAPVASFLPNGFGLFDMVGNVWQMVEDCRHPFLIGAPTDGTAWVDKVCDGRIARGGYYASMSRGSRVTTRAAVGNGFRSMGLGFRLAESIGGPTL